MRRRGRFRLAAASTAQGRRHCDGMENIAAQKGNPQKDRSTSKNRHPVCPGCHQWGRHRWGSAAPLPASQRNPFLIAELHKKTSNGDVAAMQHPSPSRRKIHPHPTTILKNSAPKKKPCHFNPPPHIKNKTGKSTIVGALICSIDCSLPVFT